LDAALKIERLKTRAEFLAAAQAPACARGAVLVQRLPKPERLEPGRAGIAAGFTATKKIGGAVVRNRCKRRLREAARQLLPLHGEPGHDYVFIARSGLPDRPWARLLDDVRSALISLAAGRADPARPPRPPQKKRRSAGPTQQPPPGKTPSDE
jgi:ribonuclease P protein component